MDDLRAYGLRRKEEWGECGAPFFNYALTFSLQPAKITEDLSQDGREVLYALLGTYLVTSARVASTDLLTSSRFKIRG
jgi:hypothetical protein